MSTININNSNNQVTAVNSNQSIVITDNNASNTVNITQPVTDVVIVATPGPIGPQGPSGSIGPSGSQGPQGEPGPAGSSGLFVDLGNGIWQTTSSFRELQIIGSTNITDSLTVNNINFTDDNGNIATNLFISGSNLVLSSGSILTLNGGLTGSVFGTSSWALNVVSSSYALTASYALNGGGGGDPFPYIGNAEITGGLFVLGNVAFTGSLFKFSGNTEITGSFKVFTGSNLQPALQVNSSGTLVLGKYSTTPTPVTGGFIFSGSDYFLGF